MRGRTADEAAVLASDDYYVEQQIIVGDRPSEMTYNLRTWIEAGYDPFLSGTIRANFEEPLVSGQFTFQLGRGEYNLSPLMTANPTARAWSNMRPFFDPGRYLTMLTRTVGRYDGAPPADRMPWRRVFDGRIDTADPGEGETLVVSCRDWLCDWMDRWIEPNGAANSWPIAGGLVAQVFDTLAALFLDGWLPPSYLESGYAGGVLQIVGDPQLEVTGYPQEPGSGLLALREVALLNGWDLRGRYLWQDLPPEAIRTPDRWRLLYNAPDRAMSGAQVIFGAGREYSFHGLAKTRDEIRNRVRVVPAGYPRIPVYAEDAVSIANYGLKFLGVSEDAASRIVTLAQAQALADAILSDTKESKLEATVELNFQPLIEVNDVLRFSANAIHMDQDLLVAVAGYQHTFAEDGTVTTSVTTRARPAAANEYWRAQRPRRMEYASIYPPSGPAAEGAIWVQYKAEAKRKPEEPVGTLSTLTVEFRESGTLFATRSIIPAPIVDPGNPECPVTRYRFLLTPEEKAKVGSWPAVEVWIKAEGGQRAIRMRRAKGGVL